MEMSKTLNIDTKFDQKHQEEEEENNNKGL